MTIRTIMIPLERAGTGDAALRAALDVAVMFGAKAIGAMACEEASPAYFVAGAVDFNPIEMDRERLRALMRDEEQRFRRLAQASNVPASWRCSIDWPADFIACEARSADLLVVAVAHLQSTARDLDVGGLVLRAGRPVLLLPADGLRAPIRALIPWKDTREARRAVVDALPFLAKAKSVTLLEIAEGGESVQRAKERIDDVAAWLAAHDVHVSVEAVEFNGGVEDRIDSAALEVGANLIVAGGYGHTRLGEWIFGGVTRHLLSLHRSAAVLLSH